MSSRCSFAAAVLVCLLILSASPALAAHSIPGDTSIGTWDSASRTYTLTTGTTEQIRLSEGDLTLDGNGHTLSGNSTYGSWQPGVLVEGKSKVTIKNMIIEGFTDGIILRYATECTVTGNTVRSNIYAGIEVGWSSGNTVTDNIATENGRYGINMYWKARNNTVADNTVTSNGSYGINLVMYSDGNTLRGNTISSNSTGIWLSAKSTNNVVEDNNLESNSTGMNITSSNSTLINNNVTDNGWGIRLYNCSNNTLTGNTLSGNSNNFNVDGSLDEHFEHSVDTTNTVNGRPIFYIKDAANQVYDSAAAGAILLIRCQNITIQDPTPANQLEVVLWNTHYSTLENLTTNGIKLRNSSNNTLAGNSANAGIFGIFLYNSSGNTLTDNTVNSIDGYGITLDYGSSNNVLTGNTALSNRIQGIRIYQSDGNALTANTANANDTGIAIVNSSGCTLTGNSANSNRYHGILIGNSSGCPLTGNSTDSNSKNGIMISSSEYNILTGNVFSNNSSYGLELRYSSNNEIYSNKFISNSRQARDYSGSGNVFNVVRPTGGNYWSDWECPDSDQDGFVDIPYVFSGGQDDLPRVPEGGCHNESPVADAGPDLKVLVNQDAMFDASLSYDPDYPDGEIVSYRWDFGDGRWDYGLIAFHTYTTVGTYTVTLTVTDDGGLTADDQTQVAVLTPVEACIDLIDTIESMNLQQGIENSLDVKIQAVQDALVAANAGVREDAVNKLEAFINAVEAQRGKVLTDQQADQLISYANRIITGLNEPTPPPCIPPCDGGGGV